MIQDKKMVAKFAAKKRYSQSFNGSPISLIYGAALSAINVHKKLGMSYEGFLFEFKEDYGSMNYFEKDLKKIGSYMWQHINQDSKYLQKFIVTYRKEQDASLRLYEKIDKINLQKATRTELIKLLRSCIKTMRDGVGTGHVIEGISFVGDPMLKKELDKFLGDQKKSNRVFSLLTTPEEKSFLSNAEDLLHKIYKNPKNKKLINKFKKEFGWIRNSYDFRRPFSDQEIIQEAKAKKDNNKQTLAEIKKEKEKLIKDLKIPEKLVVKLNYLAEVGAWQDERKKFILLACEYIFRVLEEYARKTKVDIKYLRYALPGELGKANKIIDILKERYEKSYWAVTPERICIVTGKDYDKIHTIMTKHTGPEVEQINGTVASTGKVIGKVKICSTIESLKKVKEGDILVASMTRPEYIGAMRKAAGFITDEGGITCHAAIISREMRKPCVIGTKIATEVLKDGDLVEVNANHGVVKILKK